MTKTSPVSWLLFILLSIIWGSSFILMKRGATELTGWQIGAIRISAAGLVLIPFGIFHLRGIPMKKIPLVILSGILGNLFPAFLFGIAIEKKVNSSVAGILNALTPLFVIVIAILVFRKKIENRKIAGVIVGFIGLLVLKLSSGLPSVDDLGLTLLILLATLMYGLNVNLVGNYLKEIDPFKMTSVSLSIVAIPALFIAWQQNVFELIRYDDQAKTAIGIISILGITGTALATALFYSLIQRAGSLFASLVTYGIPIVAIIWGIADGEKITWVEIVCLTIILAGVWLANSKPKHAGS